MNKTRAQLFYEHRASNQNSNRIREGGPGRFGTAAKQHPGLLDRIRTERLHGYSPELKPQNGIWRHLKRVGLKNLISPNIQRLKHQPRKSRMRIFRKKRTI